MELVSVAIQGSAGAFHEQAAKRYFMHNEVNPVYCPLFKDVFHKVTNGDVNFGLVAIENSLFGSINETDKLLLSEDCQIVGEVYLRINHCLIGTPDAELSDITDVYSQDVALGQCASWFDTNLPNATLHNFNDTAASVEYIKEQNNKSVAAVASKNAAEVHGMKVLQEEIEDDKLNFTRFVIISSKPANSIEANKTSIVLQTAHKPGALYEVLGMFKDLGINLTKLDSKPIAGKPWQYMFYIDFESGLEAKNTQELLKQLDTSGHETNVLGTYLAAEAPKS